MPKPIKHKDLSQQDSLQETGMNSMQELFTQWRKKRKIRAFSSNQALVGSKRKKIIESASKAFRQKGVNGVTMEDIARQSRMCVGSIYRYFGSKDDLLFSFLEVFENWLLKYVIGRLPEIEKMEPKEALKELMKLYMGAVDASRDQVLILYLDARTLPKTDQAMIKQGDAILVGLFEQVILRGIKSGDLKITDAKLCAQNIKALIDSWAVRGWAINKEKTAEQYIDYQIEFLLGGLAADVK
jgi:AcrR family transcriptional regulator